jgi:hypothetical protein
LSLYVGVGGRISADALGHLAGNYRPRVRHVCIRDLTSRTFFFYVFPGEGSGAGNSSALGGGGGGFGGWGSSACGSGAAAGGAAYGWAVAPNELGYCVGGNRQPAVRDISVLITKPLCY